MAMGLMVSSDLEGKREASERLDQNYLAAAGGGSGKKIPTKSIQIYLFEKGLFDRHAGEPKTQSFEYYFKESDVDPPYINEVQTRGKNLLISSWALNDPSARAPLTHFYPHSPDEIQGYFVRVKALGGE